jgi:hypothetical protein
VREVWADTWYWPIFFDGNPVAAFTLSYLFAIKGRRNSGDGVPCFIRLFMAAYLEKCGKQLFVMPWKCVII